MKKMKPVLAWALVFRSDDVIRGAERFVLDLHKTRAVARDANESLTKAYGPICRIARIKITEVS